MTRVACIGLGVMGANMARHLRERFDLVVYDIDSGRRAAVHGTRQTGSLAEAASQREADLLSLPGSGAVREVSIGTGGLVEHLAPGAVVIDASTTEPAVTREVAAALEARGHRLPRRPGERRREGRPGGNALDHGRRAP